MKMRPIYVGTHVFYAENEPLNSLSENWFVVTGGNEEGTTFEAISCYGDEITFSLDEVWDDNGDFVVISITEG